MAQRREPRIPNVLPVWVSGRDVNGHPFQQTAKVVEVSRLGGRLAEIRCLRSPGDTLEIRHRGKKAQFCVVWIDEPEGQAGIRCSEPGKYIWGVSLPANTPSTPQPAAAKNTPSQALATPSNTPPPEPRRRKYPRHHCLAGIEVRRTGLEQRIWGRMRELSEGGCFVETPTPLPSHSKVELLLGAGGIEVRCKGVVCYSRPGRGMGIMFTEVPGEYFYRLQELVASLAKGGRFSKFA